MAEEIKKTAEGGKKTAGDKKEEKQKKDTKEKKKTDKAKNPEKAKKTEKKTDKAKKTEKKAEKAKKESAPKKKKKKGISLKLIGGLLLSKMARGGAKELRTNADEVNKLNVFPVPDGDTGDNMRMTIESGIAAIENMDSDDLSKIMKTFSHGMLLGARGNSGVIVSQFFAGISKGLKDKETADALTFGHALEEGVKQAYASVMTPTEGTILTVAREAVEYAVSRINERSTIRTLFADLTKEMHASVERTPEILTVLKEAGVVDSGGAGLFYIIDGFNRVLNGEEVPGDEPTESTATAAKGASTEYAFGADSEMTFGYCTETLLQLQNSKCNPDEFDVGALKDFLGSIGDSIVAFKTESIVKIHVHTFTPERVLEYCRRYGEFLTVKIENMSVQHTEGEAKEEKEDTSPTPSPTSAFAPVTPSPVAEDAPTERKKNAKVAVSNGVGVDALFSDLGVDVIVEGGQTQNPSAGDFLAAFEKINADNIFIFPNNGNIIMAASQAAELYEAAKVYVIPSKNIGMGYVALSAIDFDSLEPEDILYEAEEVMKRVTTGYVSPAIRDADMNGVHITNGDTIGIINKEIVVSDADFTAATHKLASMLLSEEDKFMLTVFSGADATAEMRDELSAYLAEAHPDAEVYFIDGEQQIYPFIFAAE
ncbi:MAG: DAK2 domain-containing protein [Clostridia bacterium]|nr:DAK2 domain-containing protein [Clostridia bacterium]